MSNRCGSCLNRLKPERYNLRDMDGRRRGATRSIGPARQMRQRAPHATQTVTVTESEGGRASTRDTPTERTPPTLRLQLTRRRRVRWTSDTHDNEHENKRSSKSCCIFHKKRKWDESSSESGEDIDDSDDDHGNDHDDCYDDSNGDSHGGTRSNRAGASSQHFVEHHHQHRDGESDSSSSSGGPVRSRRRRHIPTVEDSTDDSDWHYDDSHMAPHAQP